MANEIERVTEDGEIIAVLPEGYSEGNQSLAISIARAEIDQQITTAHAYPRSVKRAVDNIMSLATLDEKSAAECMYALPRGGKPIKGPSVRLAEIIAGQWGNNRVGSRVVHVDRVEKYVEAEGVFHDLETNSAVTSRVRRRIVDSKGRLFSDDMVIVTGNAAASIAKRNAILGGVPKAVWRRAYEACERVVAGDVKTLVERRGDAMKAFAAFGVKPEQVFLALGVAGLDDIGLDHMATLIGMHSALKSGEVTVEEMFRLRQAVSDGSGDRKDLAGQLADVAGGGGKGGDTGQGGGDGKPAAGGGKAAKGGKAAAAKPAAEKTPAEKGGGAGAKATSDAKATQDAGSGEADDEATGGDADDASAGDNAGDQAAGDGDDDGPTADEIEIAYERGQGAFADGMGRKAVPPEYREPGREKEAARWVDGYDDAKADGGTKQS